MADKPHFVLLGGCMAMYYDGKFVASADHHPAPFEWARKIQALYTEWGLIHGS